MASDGKLVFETGLNTSGFDKGVQGLAGKAKSVGSGISSVANITKNAVVTGAKAMTAGLGAFGAYSLKAGADFDAGMSEVQAISGASGQDLEALRNKAKEMGATTKFSATQSAEALKYMAMAGWKSEQMIAGLPGIMNLAAASGEDLGLVSDIVTDSLTAFGLKAEDTGSFVDILASASSNANTNVSMLGESFKYAAPIAGALGYSAEDTALALGLMANAGIKSSQAGTSLRGALTRLAKPTGEVADYMEKLGVSVTDSQGNMLPFRDVMIDLRAAFADLTEEQQAQAATALFGKNAMSGMLAVINASDEDFDKLANAIDNSKGSAEAMAKVMNDNLKGDFTIMMSALEGLGISLYENFDKPMRSVVQSVTGQLDILNKTVQDDLTSLPEVMGGMIADGAVAIASKAPMMIDAGKNILLSFINGLDNNQDKLANSAVTIITSLVNAILEVGGRLLEVGGELILKIGQGLADNASTIAPRALEVIGKLSDGFLKALPQMVKIGADIIKGIAQGLKENPQIVADAVPAILKAFATAMLLFQGADIAKGMLGSIAKGFTTNGSLMDAPAKGVLGHLNKAFMTGGNKLQSIGTNLIGKFSNGISKATSPILKAGKDTVDYLGIAILEGKDKLLAPAKGLVDIIGNTISKVGGSSLVQSGAGLVSKISTGFSNGFGHLTAIAGKIIPLLTTVLSNPVGLVIVGGLLIGAIIKGFNLDVPKLAHSAGEIVGKVAKTIVDGAGKLLDVGLNLIGKIGEGFKNGVDAFINLDVAQIPNMIGNALSSGFNGLKEIGGNLIQGIKDGWNGKKTEVTEETSQLPNEVNDSIDTTVTQETGQSMIEGVIEGIKYGQSSVAEAYRQLIQLGISETDAKAILRQEGSLSIQEYAQGIFESTGSVREAYGALMSEGLTEMDAAEQFFEIAGLNIDSFAEGTEDGGITYREKLQQIINEGKEPLQAIEEMYEQGKSNSDSFVQGAEEGGKDLANTFNRMIMAGFTELEVIDQMYQKGQLNVDAFGQGSEAGRANIIAIYESLVQSGVEKADAIEKLHQMGLLNVQGYAEGTSQGQFDVESAMDTLIQAGVSKTQASELMSQAGKSNIDAYVSGVNSSEGAVSGAYDNAFAKPFSIMDFFRGDPTQREGRKTGEKYATGIGESKYKVQSEAQSVMHSAEQAFTQETQAQAQGQKIGNEFANGITTSQSAVEIASKGVGDSAYNGLNNLSEQFKGAGDKSMQAYAQGLGQQKGQVINSINEMGNQINTSLSNTSSKSSQTASQMMSKIANSVSKGSGQVTQSMSQMSNKVNTEVKKMGTMAGQSSTEMMNKMSQSVKSGTNKINQDFKQMSSQTISTIKNTSSQVTSAGNQMMNQFTSTINKGANNSINAIRNMGSRMVSSVNNYRGQFQNAGYNLMAGLRAGINSGASGVINSAINVMNRAVSAAKRAASIHSPSRVWRDEIGAMLPIGMAKGIDAESGQAIKAAENMMRDVRNSASTAIDVSISGEAKSTDRKINNTAQFISDAFSTSMTNAGQTVGTNLIMAGEYVTDQALLNIQGLTENTATSVGNQIAISTDQIAGYTSSTIQELAGVTTNSIGSEMMSANSQVGNFTVNLIGNLTQRTISVITNELVKSANIVAGTVTKIIQDLTRQVNQLIADMDRAMDKIEGGKGSKSKYKSIPTNPSDISLELKNNGKNLSDEQLKNIKNLSNRNLEIIEKLKKVEESKRPLSDAQLDNLEKLNKRNVEIVDKLKDINEGSDDRVDDAPVKIPRAEKLLQSINAGQDEVINAVDDAPFKMRKEDKVNLMPAKVDTKVPLSDDQLRKIKLSSDANLDAIEHLRKINESDRTLTNAQLDNLEKLNTRNVEIVKTLQKLQKEERLRASQSQAETKKSSVPLTDDQLRNIKIHSDFNLDAIEKLRKIDEKDNPYSKEQLDKLEQLNTRNVEIVKTLQKIQKDEKNTDYAKLIDNARATTQKTIDDSMIGSQSRTISALPYRNVGNSQGIDDININNGDLTTVIELDGREVARAVTPFVSQEISKDRRRRQP